MKNTLKKLIARSLRPLTRYIDNKVESIVNYTYEEAHSDLRSEVEDLEYKVDNCVSLDWFSEEIVETNAFQELKSEVEELREAIKELKGESNE
tara:strand:+ start:383 stop:661 length:279 start_codon:yes stop_codon:yes gene_type:complete